MILLYFLMPLKCCTENSSTISLTLNNEQAHYYSCLVSLIKSERIPNFIQPQSAINYQQYGNVNKNIIY